MPFAEPDETLVERVFCAYSMCEAMCIVARVSLKPYGEETEDYYLVYCIYIDYSFIQRLFFHFFCCCCMAIVFICDTLAITYGCWYVILTRS